MWIIYTFNMIEKMDFSGLNFIQNFFHLFLVIKYPCCYMQINK